MVPANNWKEEYLKRMLFVTIKKLKMEKCNTFECLIMSLKLLFTIIYFNPKAGVAPF